MWEQHRLGEAASLIESLKSNAHLIIDARTGKNLTHLQWILLFKDSSRVDVLYTFDNHGSDGDFPASKQ